MLDLEPIKRRLAAATPGPWLVDDDCGDCGRRHVVEARWKTEANEWGGELSHWHPQVDGCCDPFRPADAVLIANAPADLAALVAEVERLQRDSFRLNWLLGTPSVYIESGGRIITDVREIDAAMVGGADA